uniref:Uncharacterized protein n=1 Tax=Acidithiobacillus ferrooxidans TaxID=920 RepID=Q8VLY6_ACIFR|nr:hypothetical protein [Acidithiobacillus ferrooxidans]
MEAPFQLPRSHVRLCTGSHQGVPLRLSELRHTAALDPVSDRSSSLTLRGRATTQRPRAHSN